MKKRIFVSILPGAFGLLLFSQTVCAQGTESQDSEELISAEPSTFGVPAELQGQVEFWRLIYTRYGKNHTVFHHRDHPEIIYSVMDFTDSFKNLDWKKFLRAKERTIETETKRIQAALQSLGRGQPPQNAFERRLQTLFAKIGGGSAAYRAAADIDQIRTQTGIRERYAEAISRSGRYLHAIEMIFRSEGLPSELARIPFVESSFDYDAYSSAGAAGIWQFMRSTGKNYLRISASIDERRDPILSSRAAAHYLSNAYAKLGSWPLAITSYNHGLSGMMRAAKQVGTTDIVPILKRYEGPTFGFASKNFYTEFLAALEVERNWKAYFPEIEREQPWHFDEIKLERAVSYHDIMKQAALDGAEFQRLNPGILKPVLQGRVSLPSGFIIKVPRNAGTALAGNIKGTLLSIDGANRDFIAKLESQRKNRGHRAVALGESTYKVQSTDTIGSIARRFSMNSQYFIDANGITNPKKLRAGQTLVVTASSRASTSSVLPTAKKKVEITPAPVKAAAAPKVDKAGGESKKVYKIAAGDNLTKIGRLFGKKAAEIKRLNPNLPAKLKPGMEVVIAE